VQIVVQGLVQIRVRVCLPGADSSSNAYTPDRSDSSSRADRSAARVSVDRKGADKPLALANHKRLTRWRSQAEVERSGYPFRQKPGVSRRQSAFVAISVGRGRGTRHRWQMSRGGGVVTEAQAHAQKPKTTTAVKTPSIPTNSRAVGVGAATDSVPPSKPEGGTFPGQPSISTRFERWPDPSQRRAQWPHCLPLLGQPLRERKRSVAATHTRCTCS
jgi:hypothetical protein